MKVTHRRALQRGRARGTAAVELSIALLPLMFVVMGIIEFGRLMWAQEVGVNAVREGARLAALGGSTIGTSTSTGAYEVNYRVRSYLSAAGIPTASATITVSDLDHATIADLTSATIGDRIQVQLSIPYSAVALSSPWFLRSARITAASIMRKESP